MTKRSAQKVMIRHRDMDEESASSTSSKLEGRLCFLDQAASNDIDPLPPCSDGRK